MDISTIVYHCPHSLGDVGLPQVKYKYIAMLFSYVNEMTKSLSEFWQVNSYNDKETVTNLKNQGNSFLP